MLENHDVIVIFPIFDRFGAIHKLDSWCIVHRATFYLTKTENRTNKSLKQLSY